MDDAPPPKRPRGRPRRVDAPVVDWDAVDRALVHGEAREEAATGRMTARFPSLTELGARYGVSKNRIWQYATKHKCMERRQEAAARAEIRYDQKVVEKRAEARALGTADVLGIIDGYIDGFRQAVAEGKVQFTNPADLDRLVRLKELILGNADSRQEVQGGLTLEALQARHHTLRARVEGLSPEVSGLPSEDEEEESSDAAAPP